MVNLRNPLLSGGEARKRGIHLGFEPHDRCHQRSETGISVPPQKGMMSFKNLKIIYMFKNILNVNPFQGKHLHSRDYKDYQGFENKRVVVIGLGNSGGDIAVELGICAKQVRITKFPLIFVQLLIFNSICKQECIRVGCVPSAAVAVSPRGFCLSACWDTSPSPPGADPPGSRPPQTRCPPPETCCKACWDTTCNACWDSTPPWRPAAIMLGYHLQGML